MPLNSIDQRAQESVVHLPVALFVPVDPSSSRLGTDVENPVRGFVLRPVESQHRVGSVVERDVNDDARADSVSIQCLVHLNNVAYCERITLDTILYDLGVEIALQRLFRESENVIAGPVVYYSCKLV